jgi:very-short-patch-repair endonuclease
VRLDDELHDLAAGQYGLLGSWQIVALGATKQELYRLRRSSAWEQLSERVLGVVGAPTSERRSLMAGALDASPGAAVSAASAAYMWGAPGFNASPVQVVRPKGVSRRPSTLAIVHEVVDLHPSQIKVLDGIPVVSPSRVVCELAGSQPHRAERVLDRFWSERLLDGATFRRTVEQLKDKGRRGSTLFRELDAARGPGYIPPASSLEKRFMEICQWPMRRQVDSGGEEWCGRVDFRDHQLPLIVEIQSERYHSSLVDQVADAARRSALEAAGFIVVEVWDTDVWHRPQVVNGRIRDTRFRLHRQAVA